MTILERTRCKIMADQVREKIEIDDSVYDALCAVPREYFTQMTSHAYRLDAVPIAANQYLSSPLTVAKITQLLELKGVDSILEIGCGSGYQAAILSRLVRRVFSIERIDLLVKTAKQNFKTLEFQNINVRSDDGQKGWAKYAPYERILFSAFLKEEPKELFAQLEDGGLLLAPMQIGDKQHICIFRKNKGQISKEIKEECLFVPILDGKA